MRREGQGWDEKGKGVNGERKGKTGGGEQQDTKRGENGEKGGGGGDLFRATRFVC